MKLVWWLAAIVAIAQVALIVLLGPERALAASGWVLAPANFLGGGLAFYHWRRYRQDDLREQPVPMLPLALMLVLSGLRYVPGVLGGAKGEAFVGVLSVVGVWLVLAEIRLVTRQYRSALATERPNER